MKTLVLSCLTGLLLSSMALSAADITGRWSGSFEPRNDEQARPHPAYLILKQDGNKLTGSGGPREDRQIPIENGKVEGDRLTFEIPVEAGRVSFDVVVKGDEMSGEMSRNAGAETAKISLKRVEGK